MQVTIINGLNHCLQIHRCLWFYQVRPGSVARRVDCASRHWSCEGESDHAAHRERPAVHSASASLPDHPNLQLNICAACNCDGLHISNICLSGINFEHLVDLFQFSRRPLMRDDNKIKQKCIESQIMNCSSPWTSWWVVSVKNSSQGALEEHSQRWFKRPPRRLFPRAAKLHE